MRGCRLAHGIEDYTALIVHVGLVTVVITALVGASILLGPRRRTRAKDLPYESGTSTPGSARQRFSVHFYLVAMLFILFDVEAVLLLPWAVTARSLGAAGVVEVIVFVLILALGLGYAWRKGALSLD